MNTHSIRLLAVLFLTAAALHAQVPQLINYQGRVAVDGLNFDGTGQFKFAFVSAAGTTTYWSNDGTSTAGAEPTASVGLTVTKGLYSVLLGDATLTGMTIVPATVFTHGDVHLRVWFSDGSHGFQLLTPDKRIAAVGYAMIADSVVDGAITTAKLADGAVTSAKLADGAAAANLAASNQGAVGSGGVILSGGQSSTLESAGYALIGTTLLNANAPKARGVHSGVWTGSEMIVWGGYNNTPGTYLGDGYRYQLTGNTWTEIASAGAPSARASHSTIWTGSEMIVWGGVDKTGSELNTGARYNPVTNSWSPVTQSGFPVERTLHTAVWTGTEMIIWGGYNGGGLLSNGSRYNPASNMWSVVSSAGAPSARHSHGAVWTGAEMIIWGGYDGTNRVNTGARYNPTTDSWTTISTSGAPTGRLEPKMVWTGGELLVWGGQGGAGGYVNTGGRYDPINDVWTTITTNGAPSTRAHATVIWAGNEMLVWGGMSPLESLYVNDGARYNPATGTWTVMPTLSAPVGRGGNSVVWTGSEMVVWGGLGADDANFSDGGRFNASTNSWVPIHPSKLMYLYQRP